MDIRVVKTYEEDTTDKHEINLGRYFFHIVRSGLTSTWKSCDWLIFRCGVASCACKLAVCKFMFTQDEWKQ